MWLYHVPFTICVVSVLKIAFCDEKKSLAIFFQASYDFLQKGGRQVWIMEILMASSTNKTDCHDIAEILLKVVLNTITLTSLIMENLKKNQSCIQYYRNRLYNTCTC